MNDGMFIIITNQIGGYFSVLNINPYYFNFCSCLKVISRYKMHLTTISCFFHLFNHTYLPIPINFLLYYTVFKIIQCKCVNNLIQCKCVNNLKGKYNFTTLSIDYFYKLKDNILFYTKSL